MREAAIRSGEIGRRGARSATVGPLGDLAVIEGDGLGGVTQAGWGREAGMLGVEEYTQVKSVHIELGARDRWIA